MTGTCLAIGAASLMLAVPEFSLSWTHSVERITWQETWAVHAAALSLEKVAIKGSGAGMEPADHARLDNGWWVWESDVKVPQLLLAASGASASGWTLCADGTCHDLGKQPGAPVALAPCASAHGANEAGVSH